MGKILLWIVLPLLFPGLTAGIGWCDNSFCLGCHQDQTLTMKDVHGKSVSLFVSKTEFKSSVHAKLDCSDCHTQIKDDTHAAGGEKTTGQRVNCGGCHREAEREYQQSVHANVTMKGMEGAAYCYDCHGKHNILSSQNPKSMTYFSNIEKTCDRCHANIKFVREHALGPGPTPEALFKGSVHRESGKVTCTSCHGSHNLRSLIDPRSSVFRSNIPETCGSCHPQITKEFTESIHGVLAAKGRSDAPTCTTCHGIHGIKAVINPNSPVNERRIALTTCPQCHASLRIAREYGFSTAPVKSYLNSFHGLYYRGGDPYVAECASCHGVHDIRPPSDPESTVNKNNLKKTCGRCHPDASESFTKLSIHTFGPTGRANIGEKVVGWVRTFYIVIIIAVVGGMVFLNFTDWLRKTIDRRL
ncbi:MAG: cytochrome c3 family protein [Thermodesulfobacteriota bacterium]|jgi:hypothetical protein